MPGARGRETDPGARALRAPPPHRTAVPRARRSVSPPAPQRSWPHLPVPHTPTHRSDPSHNPTDAHSPPRAPPPGAPAPTTHKPPPSGQGAAPGGAPGAAPSGCAAPGREPQRGQMTQLRDALPRRNRASAAITLSTPRRAARHDCTARAGHHPPSSEHPDVGPLKHHAAHSLRPRSPPRQAPAPATPADTPSDGLAAAAGPAPSLRRCRWPARGGTTAANTPRPAHLPARPPALGAAGGQHEAAPRRPASSAPLTSLPGLRPRPPPLTPRQTAPPQLPGRPGLRHRQRPARGGTTAANALRPAHLPAAAAEPALPEVSAR